MCLRSACSIRDRSRKGFKATKRPCIEKKKRKRKKKASRGVKRPGKMGDRNYVMSPGSGPACEKRNRDKLQGPKFFSALQLPQAPHRSNKTPVYFLLICYVVLFCLGVTSCAFLPSFLSFTCPRHVLLSLFVFGYKFVNTF